MSQRVARIVLGEGRRLGATRRELLAAGVTGLVESNFENLPGGDRDSQGWRQERARFYKNPRNLRASARRFFSEAREFRGQGMTVGELAQAVQQSGNPGAYQPRLGEARRLVRGDVAAGQGFGGRAQTIRLPGYEKTDMQALAADALLSGSENPLLAVSGGITSGKYDVHVPGQRIKIPGVPEPRTTDGKAVGKGKVKVASNANRAGVGIKPVVTNFVGVIAGIHGSALTIGTGTRHDKMTTTGNVSDHWDGHGADIPALGKNLTRLGQDALIAAGMNPRKARKETGGVYNFSHNGHHIQILFNTNVGGNHYNHLHVGVR